MIGGTTAAERNVISGNSSDGIEIGDTVLWNRKTDGGFPEIAHLKRKVRDLVAPGTSLGHTDASD